MKWYIKDGKISKQENDGATVFEVDDHATEVIIPEGVTEIDDCTFFGCTAVKSIVIPDGVTVIGKLAFKNCTSLTDVVIPDSVTELGMGLGLFRGCEKLADENGFVVVRNILFDYLGKARDISIPDGVAGIDDCVFHYHGITSVIMPTSLRWIGSYAFAECTSLESVTIPDGVTDIGPCAFAECVRLTSIVIPDSVTEIGELAFTNCRKLKKVVVPDDAVVGEYTFIGCTSLS